MRNHSYENDFDLHENETACSTHFHMKGFALKALVNEDTLLPMMFLGLRKLGNICCGHKMFLNKIRNIFVSRTKNLCPQQMLRARANGKHLCGQQCVRHNVFSFARAFRLVLKQRHKRLGNGLFLVIFAIVVEKKVI